MLRGKGTRDQALQDFPRFLVDTHVSAWPCRRQLARYGRDQKKARCSGSMPREAKIYKTKEALAPFFHGEGFWMI